jgi:16S rRNA (uracil1498-N3)-methyltransferase
MRYFFVEGIQRGCGSVVIRGSDAGHIIHVLRLKVGDKVGLSDGRGMTWKARIETMTSETVTASLLSGRQSDAESPVEIIIGQSYLKDKKMDLLVRQLTELGISKWQPFFSERSVPRPDSQRTISRVQRWQRISKEALKQCKRGKIIDIQPPIPYKDALMIGQKCDLKILFWEDRAAIPFMDYISAISIDIRTIFTVFGPEGGFSKKEVDMAGSYGFANVGLGPRILRAETATVTAVSILQYLFGDMGKRS